jgi:sugar/nucleoside kinase (ribokinase family)
MSLTIVGSVAFDAIETPLGKTGKIIGGAGSYICLAASKLTGKANIISVVGEDFPDDYINLLKTSGIDTQGLQVIKGGKTFFWSGKYQKNMNIRETLVTELNVLADFDPVVPESCQDTEYLMLGNLAPTVQRQVIERLKKRPKLIVMDTMNFWIEIALDELKKTIALVDVLTVNDEEAMQLTGKDSAAAAAKEILQMGPKACIIKKGEHGALLFAGGKTFAVPAVPLEKVIDPTGAGDTFAGGFISYLAKTGRTDFSDMKKALVVASAAASFCVEKFGTERLAELTQAELKERIGQLIELSQIEFSGGII